MSLLEGHGNAVMNQARARARRGAGSNGTRPAGPPPERRVHRFRAQAHRARVEDAPVRGRRSVRRRRRSAKRVAAPSTRRGRAPNGSPPSTSSPTRRPGSPASTPRRSGARVVPSSDRVGDLVRRRGSRRPDAAGRRRVLGRRGFARAPLVAARCRSRARSPSTSTTACVPTALEDAVVVARRGRRGAVHRCVASRSTSRSVRTSRPGRVMRATPRSTPRPMRPVRDGSSSATPPTTRPRPSSATCCAGPRPRARRDASGGVATSLARSSGCGAPTPRALCRGAGLAVVADP